ncbi:MAG: hypothetical protein EXR62_04000 [Chloroflexi bacterium]|nr:hypothetical protein [Chloroflexota bacterium]
MTHVGGVERYGYDADGNMTLRNTEGMTTTYLGYDEENRLHILLGERVTYYTYNGDGQRVSKITQWGTTNYIGKYYEVYTPHHRFKRSAGRHQPGLSRQDR